MDSSKSKLSFSFPIFLCPASLLKTSGTQGTEIHFDQQSLPFYVHHENIKRSQHKDICKKKTVGIIAYIEMFLAPYPAIRDPSVQGPALSNKKIEGPLLT